VLLQNLRFLSKIRRGGCLLRLAILFATTASF
jgi:hypothetical protein